MVSWRICHTNSISNFTRTILFDCNLNLITIYHAAYRNHNSLINEINCINKKQYVLLKNIYLIIRAGSVPRFYGSGSEFEVRFGSGSNRLC